MDPALPQDYRARPPRADDFDEILALMAAADTHAIGEPDVDADDLRNDWEAEDFDPDRDARVAVAHDGELAAYAFGRGNDAFVYVHPGHMGRGLGAALLPFVEERVAATGAREVHQYAYGRNDAARELLAAHGYAPEQHYWRMRIELARDTAIADPAWPEGVQARAFAAGEDERPTHALVSEAFAEVPGFSARPFEAWHPEATGRLQFAAELSVVAERDGRMVGVVTCERWEAEGYVAHLAVALDHRGLGLGRGLLMAAFARLRDAGQPAVALSVNSANAAGTRLYESVGMEAAWRAERWEKPLALSGSERR